MKGVTNFFGVVTVGIVLMVGLASGVFDAWLRETANLPKPLAQLGLAGWNGMVEHGKQLEGIACDANGENCRLQRGGD